MYGLIYIIMSFIRILLVHFRSKSQQKSLFKRGCVIGNTEIDKRGDSPVFEIDRWNFQQMLDLGFSETSQNLSSFKQLIFSPFHRGDQRKKIKNWWIPSFMYLCISYYTFPFRPVSYIIENWAPKRIIVFLQIIICIKTE